MPINEAKALRALGNLDKRRKTATRATSAVRQTTSKLEGYDREDIRPVVREIEQYRQSLVKALLSFQDKVPALEGSQIGDDSSAEAVVEAAEIGQAEWFKLQFALGEKTTARVLERLGSHDLLLQFHVDNRFGLPRVLVPSEAFLGSDHTYEDTWVLSANALAHQFISAVNEEVEKVNSDPYKKKGLLFKKVFSDAEMSSRVAEALRSRVDIKTIQSAMLVKASELVSDEMKATLAELGPFERDLKECEKVQTLSGMIGTRDKQLALWSRYLGTAEGAYIATQLGYNPGQTQSTATALLDIKDGSELRAKAPEAPLPSGLV